MSAAFRLAPWIGIAFTLVAFVQLGFGLLPINAKKDPTSRLKGWSELGGDIQRLQRDNRAGMVLTDRYAITGELAFYGAGSAGVAQINERIRYVNLPPPDELSLMNAPALLVLREGGDAALATSFFEDSHRIATLAREGGFHQRDFMVYIWLTAIGAAFLAVERRQTEAGNATRSD